MAIFSRLEHRLERRSFDSSLPPNLSSAPSQRSKSRRKELVNLPHTSSSSLNASWSSLDFPRSRCSSRGTSSDSGSTPVPRRTSSRLGGSSCHGMLPQRSSMRYDVPPQRSSSTRHGMPPRGSSMGFNGHSTMEILSRLEQNLERQSSDISLLLNLSSPSPRSKTRRKKLVNLPHTSSSSLDASLSSLDSRQSRRSSRRHSSGGGSPPIPRGASSGLEGSSRFVMPPRRSSSRHGMPPRGSSLGFNDDHGSWSDISRRSLFEVPVPTDESRRENTLWRVDVFGDRLQDIDVWNY
jgi:hypothetical protein